MKRGVSIFPKSGWTARFGRVHVNQGPGRSIFAALGGEAAHVFHNCKRTAIGLGGNCRHEYQLNIDYFKRETFASRAKHIAESV
jgi:hypothetical protein